MSSTHYKDHNGNKSFTLFCVILGIGEYMYSMLKLFYLKSICILMYKSMKKIYLSKSFIIHLLCTMNINETTVKHKKIKPVFMVL